MRAPVLRLLVPMALVAFAANSLLTRSAVGSGALDAASFALVRVVTGAVALAVIVRLLPSDAPGTTGVYHLFTVRTPHRDALRTFLDERGIGTAVHYPVPLHHQPVYREPGARPLPASERAAREVLSLPFYPELRADEQDAVAAAVRDFFAAAA